MKRSVIAVSILFGLVTACATQPTDNSVKDAAETAKETLETDPASVPYTVTTAMYPEPDMQPNFGPKHGSITFVDTDPTMAIGGTLTMDRAVDENGTRLDETAEGINMYMIHWGLEVGDPGIDDDKGAGDHGGDCRGFRDTGHVVMKMAADLGDDDTIRWTLPAGTEVPEDAVYFVGHTIYGEIHNLGKCTQTAIENRID